MSKTLCMQAEPSDNQQPQQLHLLRQYSCPIAGLNQVCRIYKKNIRSTSEHCEGFVARSMQEVDRSAHAIENCKASIIKGCQGYKRKANLEPMRFHDLYDEQAVCFCFAVKSENGSFGNHHGKGTTELPRVHKARLTPGEPAVVSCRRQLMSPEQMDWVHISSVFRDVSYAS